ncbi:iron complex outermembrane recepter protein [Pseudomonas peli]|uniref:Iron complex outermembrane recepter protein n=1 Tax=Pseudomonas peli TaxID=592361 RepID=A0AB37ZC32_9PSED|nr:TonB-dependent siderophore receptor [Pseudomonas peli]NMZ71039.1 TonB-dependent siderophore receptor [Pseudomonas peli]SCW85061.1 iron complex outermembrane recepter protein [Pseudomonas peli]
MPAVLPYRLRPMSSALSPLLRWSLMLSLSASPMFVPASWAADADRRSYQVPAGRLDAALTRFAGLAGVNLSVDPALVSGRSSDGLSGEYGVEEGFARLLLGSGLQLQPVGEQAYTLTPTAEEGSMQLPSTSILGARGVGSEQPYAGGQVARSGSQGMLGDQDFMDSPFSVTSYTKEALQNQHVRTLGDAVAADPSVRTSNPAGGRFEQFTVRGFSLFNSDVSYGGLYGILPTYSIDMEIAERVDVLKGPSAVLNGIAPRGSIGGGINIVPKRATDAPITQVTSLYASEEQFGGAVDIGRRFGEDQRFGVRFNGVRQSGDTEWDHQAVERETGVLGLDLREERLRLSLDIGHQDRYADAPMERVELAAGVKVPKAEDIDRNFAQPWTYSQTKDSFGALRGEYDVSDSLMVYAAYGARKGNYDFLRHGVQATQDNGNFTLVPRSFRRDEDVKTATVGARQWFSTGSVNHTLNLSLNRFDMDFDNAGERYLRSIGNLYDPVEVAYPGAPNRFDTSAHTEDRFTSAALADTLSFAEDRLLVTLGTRLQSVKVTTWSDGERDGPANDETDTSPLVGVMFKATERLSLYANYVEGLTQGETAPSTANNANTVFAPYVSKQTEIGAKYDHGNIGMSASLFHIEQPAYQFDNQDNFKPNGELRNQGLELSMFGEPLKGFRLLGGVMFLDSEQNDTTNGEFDGNHGTGAPEINANLGAELDIQSVQGLTLTARAIHTGSQYLDSANEQEIDSWERYDLGGRYAFKVGGKPVTVRATVENVLDKTYWASAATSSDSAAGLTLSTPRTVLLSTTVDF